MTMNTFLPEPSKCQERVAFGTTLNRQLLPLKPPHTRSGNELGLRGASNLGPGTYDNHEITSFIYESRHKPSSNRGYSLGSRTALRFQTKHSNFPGPPAYQPIISRPREFPQSFKPFSRGASRFPGVTKDTFPGPGSYKHDVTRNRKVQFMGSFGGPQTLKTPITLICHSGEPEKCSLCDSEPNGDYFRGRMGVLCRSCYDSISTENDSILTKRYIDSFYKVRDCREIHSHEGTNAKLRLISDKEIRRLRLKEAYLSLYYS